MNSGGADLRSTYGDCGFHSHGEDKPEDNDIFSVRGADASIKPWGVSPRSSTKMLNEPAKRVTAVALQIHSNEAAAAHFAGFTLFLNDPGAHAPGFMLASAPRTRGIVITTLRVALL